jgi:hypothetical protein
VGSYHIAWTVIVPLRGDDLDAAVEAITDGLADVAEPRGVHDVDCGATLTTGAVEFCGHVETNAVDEAYCRFVDAVHAVIADWPSSAERAVDIEVLESAVA